MAGTWANPVRNDVPAKEFSPFRTIEFAFVADGANGSVPDLAISASDRFYMAGKYLYMAEVVPGGTAPQNLWDITIEDAEGDIFGGALANMSQTREFRRPIANGKEDNIPYDGRGLTVKVSGNNVNSATATIRLFMAR